MKKIVLALAVVLLGSFMLSDCSKDEILDHYNNIVQSAGAIELTGKSSLEGTKEKGIDDYTGTYTADYEDYEGTNLISEKTPDDLMEELEDREHLLDCLAHLSENQRQRILMLAQGMSITEIARVQHADRTTVRESIQAARKKFKKYF